MKRKYFDCLMRFYSNTKPIINENENPCWNDVSIIINSSLNKMKENKHSEIITQKKNLLLFAPSSSAAGILLLICSQLASFRSFVKSLFAYFCPIYPEWDSCSQGDLSDEDIVFIKHSMLCIIIVQILILVFWIYIFFFLVL